MHVHGHAMMNGSQQLHSAAGAEKAAAAQRAAEARRKLMKSTAELGGEMSFGRLLGVGGSLAGDTEGRRGQSEARPTTENTATAAEQQELDNQPVSFWA